MREMHLFAGIGGGVLGGLLLGHTPVCFVEKDPYCRQILSERFPRVPAFGDIETFDGKPWTGKVDVVCGGFPCQNISSAGDGKGLAGKKSGLWFEMLRVVSEVRPSYVFVENSPLLRTRGLGTILGGLANLGFDAAWAVLSAADCGAPHKRARMWILAAHPDRCGQPGPRLHLRQGRQDEAEVESLWDRQVVFSGSEGLPKWPRTASEWAHATTAGRGWWSSEHGILRASHGDPHRVDRIRALGNAQVPIQAATAFKELTEVLCSGT